jgi:hypothetical protein
MHLIWILRKIVKIGIIFGGFYDMQLTCCELMQKCKKLEAWWKEGAKDYHGWPQGDSQNYGANRDIDQPNDARALKGNRVTCSIFFYKKKKSIFFLWIITKENLINIFNKNMIVLIRNKEEVLEHNVATTRAM